MLKAGVSPEIGGDAPKDLRRHSMEAERFTANKAEWWRSDHEVSFR